MEKERKWSPAVQPFVPRFQQARGLESPQQPSASSPPPLPNPYLFEQNSKRNLSGKSTSRDESGNCPRQRPSTNNGTPGETQSKHGYSSSRRTRETTEASEQRTCVQHTTALKSRLEFCSPEKNMIRKSLDVPRRGGFRGSRSAPNPSERTKPAQADCVTFEVKLSDFPELGGVTPNSHALPTSEDPGLCWGSPSPSPAPVPRLQSTESTRKVDQSTPVREGARKAPNQCMSSSENCDPYLQGQSLEAISQSSCLAVTSWANVASQPPKKSVSVETVNHRTSAQETSVQQEEHASDKKKKQKKKKKSKTLGEGGQIEEVVDVVIHQEPPKFEDEEEFPDLSLAGTTRVPGHNPVVFTSSMKNILKKEGPGEGPGLQPEDQNKDRATAGKAILAERRKGQKAEKTSGKKSKVPVQLDIGNMLAALERKQQTHKDKQDTKPVILSVGGSLPVGHKNPLTLKKPWLQEKIAHNPLDSTSPLVKKGKQREVPKAKKPTPLKRVILKERQDRKQNRLLEEQGLPLSSEASKMAGDVTEELQETVGIDNDQQDSIGVGFSPTCPYMVEEEQSEEETSQADEITEETEEAAEKDAEETKKDAEETGKDAEETGKDAEETGKDAEETGKDAEETGKDAEETGKDAEETGKDAEETGKDAEETGKDAEETGKDAEETGKDAEETGKDAEETGKDAEETELQTKQSQPHPCPLIQPKIHSRKFRDYCSQVLSKDVDECVTNLLKELVRFQDRLYQKDPMKARMKRRLVMGLREVLKHLKLRKVKCVVISPNCERIQSKGGLDEALHNIIDTCREQGVPFVFALTRKSLGRCVNKAVPVSLVGIFNYDGAQDHYHKMIELSSEARKAYEVMLENIELKSQGAQEIPDDQLSTELLPPLPNPSEEPEYIKLWKKMLEKECNHKFLNFEEQLSSFSSDCREQMDEDENS
ncbi:hypothetical protein DPEC_G00124270 [Dallia pectoralis]|uniref:Uncharacterized protein n=1 Tax=Dallia pectoralis TaxID=75939 RepID=A0ACC2GRL8_DALPE|nr:hypothetical protein DPEC_G00124270 [Dallia pectoralis]